MESKPTASPDPPAAQQAAGEVSAPTLNYARPRRFARLRRWLRPGSPAFFMLVLALASAGAWGAWKWRLRADEKAFNERTSAGPYNVRWITFSKPPNAAALRHLNRLPGTWSLLFDWHGTEDPAAPRSCCGAGGLPGCRAFGWAVS